MTGFGVVALTLAAVGIYGVFAFFVAERSREIAVRLALNATPADVRRLVVGRGLALLGLGLAIGLAGAVGLGSATPGLLYAVSVYDAAIYLAAVALSACWLPAYRASRIDPQGGSAASLAGPVPLSFAA